MEGQRNKTSCKRNVKATLLLIELVFWASYSSSLLPALNSTWILVDIKRFLTVSILYWKHILWRHVICSVGEEYYSWSKNPKVLSLLFSDMKCKQHARACSFTNKELIKKYCSRAPFLCLFFFIVSNSKNLLISSLLNFYLFFLGVNLKISNIRMQMKDTERAHINIA